MIVIRTYAALSDVSAVLEGNEVHAYWKPTANALQNMPTSI